MHSVRISVLFTNFQDTERALKTAAKLSAGLDAEINVIVPQVVAFPLPLTEPPVPMSFTLEKLQQLAADAKLQPAIHIYLCRDGIQTLRQFLDPESVIVVGCKRRWLPSRAKTWAKELRNCGHQVVLATAVQ